MLPQPQLEVPGGHTKSYRSPRVLLLVQVFCVPKAVAHTSPLPTPLHLPAAPRCTYRPFLEAGARCRLPSAGSLACPLSVTLAAVPAPVSFNPPSQQAGQRGEDTKREVTGGGGHFPTSGLLLPLETGGLCQASRSPLPAYWVAGLLVEDAGPGAGWVGGGVSSCWLSAPAASLKPLAPTRAAAPRCFPRSS